MIKVDLQEMNPDYLEVLQSVLDVKGDEVLKFEDWDDLASQSEVIGYYNAFQVIINYGFANAQFVSEYFGIEKPLAEIENVATVIIEKILRDNAEEV